MFEFFHKISRQRAPWFLLSATALGLELSALYFQYVMKLDPCVLCVYERTAVLGLLCAGLLGAIMPRWLLFRFLAFILWGASAIWGLYLALKHTGIQFSPSLAGTCDFMANYPAWFKLDQWIPWVFNPTGFCEDIQWDFFGLTMPQTMIGVYVLYLLVLLVVFAGVVFGKPKTIFRR